MSTGCQKTIFQYVNMSVCQYVSMSICQNVNISECKFSAQVSKEKLFRMSKRCQKTLCWYVNMSICQFVSMSVCQYGRMQLLSLGIKRKVGQNVNRMSAVRRDSERVCTGVHYQPRPGVDVQLGQKVEARRDRLTMDRTGYKVRLSCIK